MSPKTKRNVVLGILATILGVATIGLGIYFLAYDAQTAPLRTQLLGQIIDTTSCQANIQVKFKDQDLELKPFTTFKAELIRSKVKESGLQHWIYKDEPLVQSIMQGFASDAAKKFTDAGMTDDIDMVYDLVYSTPWIIQAKNSICPLGGYNGIVIIYPQSIQETMVWGQTNKVEWMPENIHIEDLSSTPGYWQTVASWGKMDTDNAAGTFHLDPTDTYESMQLLKYLKNNTYCKITVTGEPNNGYLVPCKR